MKELTPNGSSEQDRKLQTKLCLRETSTTVKIFQLMFSLASKDTGNMKKKKKNSQEELIY